MFIAMEAYITLDFQGVGGDLRPPVLPLDLPVHTNI